jgi:hypothetical protein
MLTDPESHSLATDQYNGAVPGTISLTLDDFLPIVNGSIPEPSRATGRCLPTGRSRN